VSQHIHDRLSRFFRGVVLHPRRGRYLSVGLLLLTATSIGATGGPRLLGAVLAILLAHEGGHYVACRVYGVSTTWPLLLPAPPLLNPIAGTFGAVMVIRSPFPHRRALFDIGVAGPLAGMAVCLPVLWLAMHEEVFVQAAGDANTLRLGLPLAFQLVAPWVSAAPPPPGMEPALGPLGAAAWFGLLLTGLNLIPIGQLDGGHLLYALFPRRAFRISRVLWWLSLGLIAVAPSWILWAVLMRLLTRPHPATLDNARPLGRVRMLIAIVALATLVVSFIPQPLADAWPTLVAGSRDLLSSAMRTFTSN
jgi:membrane-associated protease RseP (regulator of RpoE activity)